MREGQLLFTYLHLAPDVELTDQLLQRKVSGVAYETITDRRGTLPLLTPMSEVAGRMAIQVGAHYLEKMSGGGGVLLGGVPGVPAARVVIIGGGVVGTNAAKIAVGMGAHVTIISPCVHTSSAEFTIVAPARTYNASSNPEPAPAFVSTSTR
jgi:alanine dehydrogenase